MKNLKLLYHETKAVLEDSLFFSVDNETFKFYVSSLSKIEGYYAGNLEKCFEVDLISCNLMSKETDTWIVGLDFLCGEEQLCIALRHGDVVLCSTVDKNLQCVASLDCKIEAMSWSPDQEIGLLITDRGSAIAMTQDFDQITELQVCSEDFGEGEFVNLGWGSKETQFQGSSGKFVADKSAKPIGADKLCDDNKVKVVWRGDGQYFAISAIEKHQRNFRVWNRNCELQYTSEVITGLESSFAWKPTGSLIASTQRKVHRHDVVFFELNGLQHGEFTLRFEMNQMRVKHLEWNADATILMLWALELNANKSHVQLWSMSNYHWSLKDNINFVDELSWVGWDSDHPYTLHILKKAGYYSVYRWSWCINKTEFAYFNLPKGQYEDDSYVAVIDGSKLKVTPFKHLVIPPPMCAFVITFSENIKAVCFSKSSNAMGVLTDNGQFTSFNSTLNDIDIAKEGNVKVELMAAGGNGFTPQVAALHVNGIFYPKKESCTTCPNWWANLRHLIWHKTDILMAVASSCDNTDYILTIKLDVSTCALVCISSYNAGMPIVAMCLDKFCDDDDGLILQLQSGKLCVFRLGTISPFTNSAGIEIHLDCLCPQMCLCEFYCSAQGDPESSYGVLSLSPQKRLYLNKTVLSSECTSYSLHNEYIIFTTTSHKLVFINRYVNVAALEVMYSTSNLILSSGKSATEISRKLERGSALVTVTPADTRVILQLPRGNLELIHPRPLVVSVVKNLLNNSNYKGAFTLMRKHRLNMNLIHDHNPVKFMNEISVFVESVESVDYINLFLSDLQEEDVRSTMYAQFYSNISSLPESLLTLKESKRNKICDAILNELLKVDNVKYFLSILTAHVRKSKPEIEKALIRLKELKDSGICEGTQVSDGLRHLHVLVDGRILYQESLSTYDLELALTVAQVSNNDPKEYLPFLNELKVIEDENYKRFKIDMFLKKYKRALCNVTKCSNHFPECIDLIKCHELYREALALFGKYTSQYKEISSLYAEFLTSKNLYEEAGIILARCGNNKQAIKCFTTACSWQHALNSAALVQYSNEEYIAFAKSLADALIVNKRYTEAATVLEQEANDNKAAINVLCKGNQWASALRMIRMYKLKDLIDTLVIPALVESAVHTTSNLSALREQFDRHFTRLLKVREIKQEQHLKRMMSGDGDCDLESDIASDFGSTVTGSSQSSINSRTSQKTAKSRRKQERKRYSLREGSRFEENGLLQALNNIVKSFNLLQDDISSLLRHLMLFYQDAYASELQRLNQSTHKLFIATKARIWILPAVNSATSIGAESTVNSILAARPMTTTNALTFADLELIIPPKLEQQCKVGMHLYQ